LYNSPKYRSDAVTPTAGLKGGGSTIFSLVPNPIQFYNGLLLRQIRYIQGRRSLRYTSQRHPSDIPDEDQSFG